MSKIISYIVEIILLSLLIGQVALFCKIFDWHAFLIISNYCPKHFSIYYLFVAIDIIQNILSCFLFVFCSNLYFVKNNKSLNIATIFLIVLMGIWSAVYLFGDITCKVATFFFYFQMFYIIILILTIIIGFTLVLAWLFLPRNLYYIDASSNV